MKIELKFNKKELEFLSLYNICIDTKSEISDKFKISGKRDSKSVFFSFMNSGSIFMITELQNKKSRDLEFIFIFPLKEFIQMMSLCLDDSIIVINSEGIFFSNKSKYKFESYDHLFSYYNEYEILESIKNQKFNHLTDIRLKELKDIEFCAGEGRFNIFSVLRNKEDSKNYFITSNGQSMSGVIRSNQNIILDKKINQCWIPIIFYKILNQLKEDNSNFVLNMTEGKKDGYYFYKTNNTSIIISFVEESILDIFEENKKKLYDHKYKIIINKEEFMIALKRISVITNSNFKDRIFITFRESCILLENKDGMFGEEKIKANVDSILFGKIVVLQSNVLVNIINNIDSKEIIIKLDEDVDNMAVITIIANDNKTDKFFIVNLLENKV